MADIRLRFTINENQASEQINKVETSDTTLSNVSIKQTNNEFAKMGSGKGGELLSWANGNLRFNEQGFLCNIDSDKSGVLGSEQNPSMFVWGATDNSGKKEITITISGANLKDIVIFGNQEANQFITKAYFDDIEVFSDDYKFVYSFANEKDTHTIRIVEWNRPNYNAMITLIRVQLKYMEIDKYNGLKEFESLSQSTGQPKDIFYGTLANSGSASIIDKDGELYDMLNDGVLPNSDLPIEIYANGKLIQKHLSIDSDYNTSANARTMSVEFSNVISKWNNVQYEGRPLTWKSDIDHSESAYTLLKEVMSSPKLGFTSDYIDNIMFGEFIVVGDQEMRVKDYLENITIPYAYLPSDTMQNTIDKFCVLAQLNFMQKDNGDFVFVGARPIVKDISPIVIPIRNQYGRVNTTALLKNKYKAVEVQAKKVKDIVDFSTIVYSIKETNLLDNNRNNEKIDSGYYITPNEGGSVVYAKTKSYDFTITFDIPKLTETQLEKIINLIVEKTSINIIYDKINAELWATATIQLNKENISQRTTYYNSHTEQFTNQTTQTNLSSNKVFDLTNIAFMGTPPQYGSLRDEIEANATIETFNSITITPLENFYKVSLQLTIGYEKRNLSGYVYQGGTILNVPMSNPEGYEHIIPKQLEVSFYGDKRVISFEDMTLDFPQDNTISDNETIKLNGSELLQNSMPQVQTISQNIINDYYNGLMTTNLTISCNDYYDIYKNNVITWAKGETIQVGDIVRLDKDNKGNTLTYKNGEPIYWKVTGRTFRTSGVPMVDLELQECKVL